MRFIDYFRFLREKYEVSNTELLEALSCGGCEIKKGSLSHKLNGERKISEDEFEIFITVLQLSVAEEYKLRELFKIYDFGETGFEEVNRVKEYIEQFENDTVVQIEEPAIDLSSVSAINDEHLLFAVLYRLLSDCWGKTEIAIMCQPEFARLDDILHNLGSRSPAAVKHLVYFNNENKNTDNRYNIKCLGLLNKQIIRNPQCSIRYYYDKANARSNPLTVLPFFIIAGEKALLLSHDYQSGFLVHDTALVQKYKDEFERVFALGHTLFRVIDNDIEYMHLCAELEKTANEKYYTLQYHPCVRFNGDVKITGECVRSDISSRDVVLDFIVSSWENSRKITGYHMHTAAGVQDFIRHGITVDMSPQLFKPLPEKYRAAVIEKIKANKTRISVEINDSFLRVPHCLSIVCYDSGTILVSYRGAQGPRLLLKERSLYKSLLNFFRYVYEYEQTTEQKRSCTLGAML